MNIVYLETVLVFASNSNDANICKGIIEWPVRHNISKHIKCSKLVEKLPDLSPMVQGSIDPIGYWRACVRVVRMQLIVV